MEILKSYNLKNPNSDKFIAVGGKIAGGLTGKGIQKIWHLPRAINSYPERNKMGEAVYYDPII